FRGFAFPTLDGKTATRAKSMIPLAYPVLKCDALIENEALAAPQAFLRRNLFEVAKDAAIELIDVREALAEQTRARLLAANAAGTEHRDPTLAIVLKRMPDIIGKFVEGARLRIPRALEG